MVSAGARRTQSAHEPWCVCVWRGVGVRAARFFTRKRMPRIEHTYNFTKFDNASNQLGAVSRSGRLAEWYRGPQMRLLLATRPNMVKEHIALTVLKSKIPISKRALTTVNTKTKKDLSHF